MESRECEREAYGAGASKVRRGTFQNWKWIGKWILDYAVLYVRIESFVFVLNTMKSYWKVLSRGMEAIGEGQTHLYYAEINSTCSGENREETRKDGVTPVWRFFQPGTPSVTPHMCQKLPLKIQASIIPQHMPGLPFPDPFAIRCDQMAKFQAVKCEQKWNVLLEGCCSRLYSTSFMFCLPHYWLDGSEESGNWKIIEQLFAWVTVEHMVGGN